MPAADDMRHWIKINRAPVLTLWAAVVAEWLGFDEDEALTLGPAVADLNAYSKGLSLGLFEPTRETVKKKRREKRKDESITVDLLGRAVPAMRTPDGLRAVSKDRPIKSESVRKYFERKFEDALDDAKEAMTALARSLGPVDKFEPMFDCRQVEHAEEALGELVVSCGDGAVDLEMADHALDAVAQPVEAPVPADGGLTVGSRRDDRADAARSEIVADGVAVIALVADQGAGRALGELDQRFVTLAVGRFPAGEMEGERPAPGVTETVSLTGEPAPRAAKSLFPSPPFAPAAETWPRTVVESIA